jgi:HEAT repeat protein
MSVVPSLLRAEEMPGAAEDRRLLERIETLRESSEWKQRMEAAVYLGRSGDIRARRPLVKALHDQHYAVRAAAIRSLTNLGDVRAIRPLIDRFADDEPFVRSEARRAIEQFDIDASRPYLIHALRRHPDIDVRLGAAERLNSKPSRAALRSLLDAVGDEDEVGRYCVSAIRALPEDDVIALFLEGLDATDYGVQIASVRVLADMGTPRATEAFIHLLDSEVPEVTLAATQGLRKLAGHIDKGRMLVIARRALSRFERARAMKVLGVLGGEDTAVLLLNALDDADVLVRGAAVSGIASLGETRAIPKLEEMKKHEANGRIISLVRRTLVSLQKIRDKQDARLRPDPGHGWEAKTAELRRLP